MDCDGSLDRRRSAARSATPVVRRRRPTSCSGARRPTGPGAWPLHARLANRVRRRAARAPHRRRAARPRPDAGCPARTRCSASGITDRRFGWPLEMVVRAGGAGWRITRSRSRTRRAIGRSKVTGTVARHPAARCCDMARGGPMSVGTVIVAGQGTGAGTRSKTRLCPPCTAEQAAEARRRRARRHAASRRARRRCDTPRARARRRARPLAPRRLRGAPAARRRPRRATRGRVRRRHGDRRC